jgi:DNA-binding response OmpR family regulator
MIANCPPARYLMCDDDFIDLRDLMRGCPAAPHYQYKILYVGRDLDFVKFLRDQLKGRECYIDYCPALWLAHLLLKSDLYYSLCLFDELPDATGAELAEFVRALPYRACMPIIVVSAAFDTALA